MPREEFMQVRLSASEKEDLRAEAQAQGLHMAEIVRKAVTQYVHLNRLLREAAKDENERARLNLNEAGLSWPLK